MRLSLVGIASIVSVLAACSSAPIAPASTPVAKATATTTTPAPTATTATPPARQSDAETLAARLRRQEAADLNAKSVFFDFDDYSI